MLKSSANTPADSAAAICGENRKLWLIFVAAFRLRRMYMSLWKTRTMWGGVCGGVDVVAFSLFLGFRGLWLLGWCKFF